MDISRVANIGTVSQSTLTKPSDQRTEDKSSTLASEHTDSFIRKGTIYTPAYTKKSAQKQNAEQNLLQREDSEDAVGKIKEQESPESAKQTLVSRGVSHIIRAMFVKQGEVLSGTVPSVGAEMYAEELLRQIRILYGNSAALATLSLLKTRLSTSTNRQEQLSTSAKSDAMFRHSKLH